MAMHLAWSVIFSGILLVLALYLYPPSERSETGGYTVFTCVCVCVRPSVRTQYLDSNISKMA